MNERDTHLARLLKLAAAAPDQIPVETPFGFDTRIVARWREMKGNNNGDLVRFVRRVALAAIAITVLGSVATYRQAAEDEEIGEPLTNDYALVDSAIQNQLVQ
jgi:hypothetical protein